MTITPCPLPHRPPVLVRSREGRVLGRLSWTVRQECGAGGWQPRGGYTFCAQDARLYSSDELMEITVAVMVANDQAKAGDR